MNRLAPAFALAFMLPVVSFAEPEAGVACTASSSDAECAEYWETHINWFSMDYRHGVGEHRHMPPPFGFALINFAVFFGIMYRLAAKPLKEFVASRHLTIKKDLDEAAAARQAAEAKLAEYAQRLAALDVEIGALVAAMRQESEAEKARLIAAAAVEADRIGSDAQAQMKQELLRISRELKQEMVDGVMVAAEKAVRQQIGTDDQRRLIDGFLSEIDR